MKSRKIIHYGAGLILGFALIAALLITSFEIAMYADFDVYRQEYEKYDVLSDLNMSMDDAMDVTRQMMAYLRGEGDTYPSSPQWTAGEQDFFNEHGPVPYGRSPGSLYQRAQHPDRGAGDRSPVHPASHSDQGGS